MMKRRNILLSASVAVAILAVSGLTLHYAQAATTVPTDTAAAESAIQGQIEEAIAQSVQVIPSSTVPMTQSEALTAGTTSQLLSSETSALNRLFTSTSPIITSNLAGYQNALQFVQKARNSGIAFSGFTFTSTMFLDNNTVADVAFTAQSTTTTEVRSGKDFTGAWRTNQIPSAWLGAATLQYHNGTWVIQSINLTNNNAG